MRLDAEDYVRPVGEGHEAGSTWKGVWGYRVVALLLLLVLALGVTYVVRYLTGEFDGTPVPDTGTSGLAVLRLL